MIASAPAWAVWLALGLWGVAIIVLALAVAYARASWRRLQPLVAPYLQMFAVPAMVGPAAGTGDVENGTPSSPAAPLDQCEYSDHEWSPPYNDASTAPHPEHYCLRCGYIERVPGV